MIIVVVQLPIKRSREAALAMQKDSAPTFRALADKGLVHKHYIHNSETGGGVYFWNSREAADAWYTPERRQKMQEKFGVEPIITYYESYVYVDNAAGEVVIHEQK